MNIIEEKTLGHQDLQEGLEIGYSNGLITRITHPVFGDMTEDVANALADESLLAEITREKQELVAAEQRMIAEARKSLGMHESNGGALGYTRLSLHPDVFHFWENKLGPGCWGDEGFVRWFETNFPESRVKYRCKTNSILLPGTDPMPSGTLVNAHGRALDA